MVINKRNSLSLTLSFLWRIFPLLWWSLHGFLCTFLQYSSLRAQEQHDHRFLLPPRGAPKRGQRVWRMGLVVSALTPVQSTRQKRREMETQLKRWQQRGGAGRQAMESGRAPAAGCWFCKRGKTHHIHAVEKESQNKSKDTVVLHSIPDSDQRSRKRASGTD